MPGPYDYINKGIPAPGMMRSESTENEMARRDLGSAPPVTILGDLIGRFNPANAQANALVDAIRAYAIQRMIASGGRPVDNMGRKSTYGTEEGAK